MLPLIIFVRWEGVFSFGSPNLVHHYELSARFLLVVIVYSEAEPTVIDNAFLHPRPYGTYGLRLADLFDKSAGPMRLVTLLTVEFVLTDWPYVLHWEARWVHPELMNPC